MYRKQRHHGTWKGRWAMKFPAELLSSPVGRDTHSPGSSRPGIVGVIPLILILLLAGCATVAETGRRQIILVSDQQLALAANDSFARLRDVYPVIEEGPQAEMVRRVAQRLRPVVPPPPAGKTYDFILFRNDEPNAFAMPNGDVGIFTGLFDRIIRTDDELAAVLSHEIAHVTARHSAEQISQRMLAAAGLTALSEATRNDDLVTLMSAVAGVGFLLPFSRTQESEADRIGQLYMARACYDPAAAITVWERFAQVGKRRPLTILSTHPAPEKRMQRLRQWLAEAQAEYRRRCPPHRSPAAESQEEAGP